jgi:hypothetical protein
LALAFSLLMQMSPAAMAAGMISIMPSYSQSPTYGTIGMNQAVTVWGRAWGGTAPYTATLSYGDGTSNTWSGQSEAQMSFFVGASHTYATAGSKTATLNVTDAAGSNYLASAVVRVLSTVGPDDKINMAIDRAKLFLYTNNTVWTANKVYWDAGTGNIGLGTTAFALLAFEENGHLPFNDYQADIYAQTVQYGLNTLASQATSHVMTGNNSIGVALHPLDINGSGTAITIGGDSYGGDTYPTCLSAAAMIMAFTSTNVAKSHVIPSGIGTFAGTDYYDFALEMLNSLYGSQNADGSWHYSVNPQNMLSGGDGSTHQWPNIVMLVASQRWGLPLNSAVVSASMTAFENLQDSANGGCGYSSSTYWYNVGKTGGMLAGYTVGNKLIGDANVDNAISYLASRWNNDPNQGAADGGWPGDFYAMYGVKKGLQIQGVTTLAASDGPHSWYYDLAGWLLGDTTMLTNSVASGYRSSSYAFGQNANGSWTSGIGYLDESDVHGSTAAGVLVLTKSVTKPMPVAVITPIPNQSGRHPAPFLLDASGSYHMDPNSSIVQYLWLLVGTNNTTNLNWGTGTLSGKQVTVNPAWTNAGVYTVALQVMDNNTPANYATATTTVTVTTNPLPPVAVAIPPNQLPQIYSGKIGSTLYLNGSASYDVDGYAITNYAWDLDGDGVYGTAADAALDTSGQGAHGTNASIVLNSTIGVQIGLMVTGDGMSSIGSAGIDAYASSSDLAVYSLSASSIVPGVSANLYAVFTNDAASSQGFNNVLVKFYNGNPWTTGTQLGSNYTVNLPIGGSAVITNTLSLAGGVTNIFVYVDANNAIQEWNESNNILGVDVSCVVTPPELDDSISSQSATNQAPFSFTFDSDTFADTNGFTLSYTASNVPPGLTFNPATQTFSGTPTNAGNFLVTVTASDGEIPPLTTSTTFTIAIAKATAPVTLNSLGQTYDGTAKVATATTVPPGLAVVFTYNGSNAAPTNVGSYTVVGTINDPNYVGSATNTLVVSSGTAAVLFSGLSQVYNGAGHAATVTTIPSGLVVTLTYNGSAALPTNAGTYGVTGTVVDANWVGAASTNLVVAQAAGTVTLGGLSQTYDGTPRVATATTAPGNFLVNLTYNGSSTPPTNAGTYAVVGTISDLNYAGSATGSLVVAHEAATVTLGSLSQTYNAAGYAATATTVPAGLTVTYTYNNLAQAPTNAGTYTVVGTVVDADYAGSATNNLVIGPALLTVTANNTNRQYGLANPAFTLRYNGFAGSDTTNQLTSLPVPSTLAVPASPLSNYVITVTGGVASNYSFSNVSGLLAVTKAPLLMVGQSFTRGYGQTNPTFTATVTGVMNGDNITPSFTINNVNTNTVPGTYKISLNVNDPDAKLGNYNSTNISGYLDITNALLTGVVASQSRSYGQTNAPFSVAYSGFVNGQDTNVLTGTLMFSCLDSNSLPVDTNTVVGSYDIAVTNAQDADNYTVVYVDGTLTVTPADLGVTALDAQRVYGGTNPLFSATIAGFVNGETSNLLSGQLTFSCSAATNSPVASYTIQPSATLSAPNYAIYYTNASLTVTSACLTVSANNQSRGYGAPNPPFSGTLVGVTAGDNITAGFTTAATTNTAIGSWNIVPVWQGSVDRLGNYQITTNVGTLTIGPATLTVAANPVSRDYGLTNPPLTVSYSGFMNNDTLAVASGAPSVTTSATTNSGIGSYPITVATGTLSAYNYVFSSVNSSLEVTAATLTVSADHKDKLYGETNPVFTASYSGFVNGETTNVLSGAPDLETQATTNSPAGSYAITITNGTLTASNYVFAFTNGTLTVGKAMVIVTAANATRAYGVTNPVFTAGYSGFVDGDTAAVLSGSPSLTTSATTNSSPANYTIVATNGTLSSTNYTFAFTNGTLTVIQAVLTAVADSQQRTYGQTNPVLTGTLSGVVNGDAVTASYTTMADSSSGVGAYAIQPVISGPINWTNNYQLVATNGILTINPAGLTVTADSASRVYGGGNPLLTGTVVGVTNSDPLIVTFVTAATNTSPVGGYPIVPSWNNMSLLTNYLVVTNSGTLTVTQALLTVTGTNLTRPYGQPNPLLLIAYSGFANGDNPGCLTAVPTSSTSALLDSWLGTYPITLANGVASNYVFSYVAGSLTVAKAELSVIGNDTSRAYGATNPLFTATMTGNLAEDGITFDLSTLADTNSAVGMYDISIFVNDPNNRLGAYDLNVISGTLTVTNAPLIGEVASQARGYGQTNAPFTVTYSGFANGEGTNLMTNTLTFTCVDSNSVPVRTNTRVGIYAIRASGQHAPNYAVTYTNGSLTVTQAVLTVTASNATGSYGAANPAFGASYSGFVNNETAGVISGQPSLTTAATSSSPAASYTIVATNGSLSATNYSFAFINGTLNVTPVPLQITADPQSRYYGGTNPPLTATYSGLVAGDTAASLAGAVALSCLASNTSPAGSYTIVATNGPQPATNYIVTFVNGSLTVNKVALAASANAQSRGYGAANPALTVTYSGFVNNDGPGSLKVPVTAATTATNTSPVGPYPITLSGGTNDTNYVVSLTNGILNVTNAMLVASANSTNRPYGAANPPLTITYAGLMNGETAAVLQSPPTISTTATNSSPAGSYTITLSGGHDTNYLITLTNGVMTVTLAPLGATAGNLTRTYGKPNPTFSVSYSGFMNGDTTNALTTPPLPTTTATPGSPIGTYAITLSPGAASNYTIFPTNGTLTITAATLSINASNATRTYGTANPVLGGYLVGLFGTDPISASYTTTASNSSPAGTYAIVPALVDATGVSSNYTITTNNGTLTVTAALTLTAAPGFYNIGNEFMTYPPAFVDSNALVADGGSLNFGGASLSVTIVTNAAAQDALALASQGTNSGQINITGTNVAYGGITIGSFSGGSGTNALVLALNTNATSGALSALLDQVTFATTTTNTALRDFRVTLSYSNITVTASRAMTLDRPPVAVDDAIQATEGVTITIPFSLLLTNDYDVDGDPLTVIDSSRVSANGGFLTMTATNFIYRPPSQPTNQDAFAYIISDGRGGEDFATVTLLFSSATNRLQIDASGVKANGAKLSMMGTPNQTYQIQVSTNLVQWSLMSTVTATSTGVMEILDADSKNYPQRFYRAVAQ